MLHQDIGPVGGNTKQMKEYYITTGLIVAYRNTFDVEVYNIQAPTKLAAPLDYSHEYYSRVMVQRKLSVKKKNEKTLTQLIKSI